MELKIKKKGLERSYRKKLEDVQKIDRFTAI